MSVYVDDMEASFGRMKMCHMIADSTAELLAMVDRIGVQRKWIQHGGTTREHFDIAMSKRALAIAAGAIPITQRQYAAHIKGRECAQCATLLASGATPEEIFSAHYRIHNPPPSDQ